MTMEQAAVAASRQIGKPTFATDRRRHGMPHHTGTMALVMLGGLSLMVDIAMADTSTEAGAVILPVIESSARCQRWGINRMVELRARTPQAAPCEVAYLKPDEDQSTTSLWRAQNDFAYCQQQYDAFLVKLEDKLDWDCAVSGNEASPAPMSSLESGTETASGPEATSEEPPALVEAVTDTPERQASISENPVEAIPEPRVLESEDTAVAEPELAAAVVSLALDENDPGVAVSMEDVRARIPSGPYEAIEVRGMSLSACPPGGSFFWNTRNPDQPVLEMGRDAQFTFSTARGRVGQGFSLRSEPALAADDEQASRFDVEILSAIDAGTLQARVRMRDPDEDSGGRPIDRVCQYRLGGS